MNSSVSTLNPDPHTFESVVFRLSKELKFDDNDPLIADFVLIHSPIKLASLVVAIIFSLKLAEHWMKSRSAFTFAKPAFLVNCGLTFGINGCGVLIGMAITEGGDALFKCLKRSDLSLGTICCRYIVFVYMATTVYDLFSLLLLVFQKQKISNILILRQLVWISTAFVIAKNQPFGFTVLVPLVHCFMKVLHNMMTVMETASKELKPSSKWSSRLDYASIALHLAMLSHQIYFYAHNSSCCSQPWVSPFIVTAIAIQTLSLFGTFQKTNHQQEFTTLILG